MDKSEELARARAVVAALNMAIEAVKEAERQAGEYTGGGKILHPGKANAVKAKLAELQAKPLGLCGRAPS